MPVAQKNDENGLIMGHFILNFEIVRYIIKISND
jgi:hypothetical protein